MAPNPNLFSNLAADIESTEKYKDPVVWAREKLGIELWSKQQEIVRSVMTHKQTAVRSAHGTGKSLLAAVLACWWIDTHPVGRAKVITTAPSYNQVHTVIWDQIRAFAKIADMPGQVQQSDNWIIDGFTAGQGRRPADYNPYSFQGQHADYVLAILDEACGIPKWLWDAAISITTTAECRTLAIGNPDDPNSEFKFKFDDQAGGKAWNKIKIAIWDAPYFTGERPEVFAKTALSDQTYVDTARDEWGVGSALWAAKIEGDFPEEDDSSTVPVSYVEAAHNRHDLYEDIEEDPEILQVRATEIGKVVSVDVAYTGRDKTVIAQYKEPRFLSFESFTNLNVDAHVREIKKRTDKIMDKIVIDVGGGYGEAVFEKLKEYGFRVVAFNGGAKTAKLDSTRTMGFTRVRSAAMWNVREKLNPNGEPTISIPRIDQVKADLTTPKYEIQLDKIQVESKQKIRDRLRRSTDFGDTVMMALWVSSPTPLDFEDRTFNYLELASKGKNSSDDVAFSWQADDDWRENIDGISIKNNFI